MVAELRIRCCPYFQREVESLVASSKILAGMGVETYALKCLPGSQKGARVPRLAEAANGRPSEVIIGGGCLKGWDLTVNYLDRATVLAPPQCFHLVAPPALVDALIAEGAYLLTPGWLADWRRHIAAWGFDQDTARQFFRETTQKLVLLDTGAGGDCQAELTAMGQYLDLPWQSIPVGLDMFRLNLEKMALELKGGATASPPPDHYFSDHLMMIDLMTDLLDASGEQEALDLIHDLFGLLFAPSLLVYEPPGKNQAHATALAEADFAWTGSGRGFMIRLRHRGEELGLLLLDELAFAEYKERYLAIALPLANICAMAIANARAAEASEMAQRAMRAIAGIVASSDDAIIGKSLEGVIVSWNKGASRGYGYDEEEVLGRNISFLAAPDQPDPMPRMLENIKNGQPVGQEETVWVTKDGRRVDVSLQVSPVLDEAGQIVGASSIARDITKEKEEARQELKALEAQLLQAQKLESVGRLAGGVAHDFNNILAIILGYTELALLDTPPGDQMCQTLEQIQQAAERAKGLTRQILAFARKQLLQMSTLSLNDVATGFSKMIKRLIGEDIVITMTLEDDLPLVNADPAMMEQILLNLAVNARDAMPDGGELTIETKTAHLDQNYASARFEVIPGDYVMLAVGDTGAGMDEATRQKIFEPFFTTKRSGEGTGLGLSTVYGIVKQHGGNIWVYSEPGQGTIFKVYLPVAQASGATVKQTTTAEPPPTGGESILVVEDDAGLRELICATLTRIGYHVLCAATPLQAQELARREESVIDLMLTDVVMPGMNGKALYESLAALRPRMKVVYMSGYTENVIANRGVLQDGVHFIQKPFSTKQLSRKLSAILAEDHQAA